jgi:hypothetical protein
VDSSELGLEIGNLSKKKDLVVTSLTNVLVLIIDNLTLNKYSIFVISGNRLLRNLNLTLLDIDHGLEVVTNLVNSITCLLLSNDLLTVLLFERTELFFKEADIVLKSLDLLFKSFFVLVHEDSGGSLLLETLPIFFRNTSNHIFVFIVFSVILFFDDFSYSCSILLRERIKINDTSREFNLSLAWLSTNLRFFWFTLSYKVDHLSSDIGSIFSEVSLDSSFLVFNTLLILKLGL